MIILTLFGTTVGLKVLHLPLAQAPSTVKLEDAWIAITGSQMTVRPDKDGYVVLRKKVGPHLATWIGLYRPAREIGYDRSGGFYGAGAWLIDSLVDANLLMQVIRNLADQIRSVAMDGDRFTKCILDCRSSFVQPPQTSEMISTAASPSAGCKPAGGAAFVLGGANSLEVIEWAQRAMSASAFSKVTIGAPEHAPAGGFASSIQFFRSLPLAIEGVYQRTSSDLTNARSEVEQARVQVYRIQADNQSLQSENNQLEEKIQEITKENQKLKHGSGSQKSTGSSSTNTAPAAKNGHQKPTDQTDEPDIILFYIQAGLIVILIVTILVTVFAVFSQPKPGCSWYLPLCTTPTSSDKVLNPASDAPAIGQADQADKPAAQKPDLSFDLPAPIAGPPVANANTANVLPRRPSDPATGKPKTPKPKSKDLLGEPIPQGQP